ncbi:GlxA family transcriptional regulator [Undibacterium sp. TJN19]|uniref:GlxA family transcriptional regulator n=1 Tax=Undibacterium sp. TJN19 TaxID=3413055 RepID=UPI003BF039F5
MDNNTRTIVFITLDGVQSLDLTGPMEVFAMANLHKPPGMPAYRLIVASPHGGNITTHAGLEIHGISALRDLPADIDTIIVTSGSEAAMREAAAENILLPWLRERSTASTTRRIASVCIGALVLAAAGLLNGRRATTHWNCCALLQKLFPDVKLDADAIFTADGPIYTSAGVTAGIDLCLSLLEADGGSALSLTVARELVLYMRRAGGQSQYSHTLKSQVSSQTTTSTRLQQLLNEILTQPTGDLRTPALAARVHMSERTFSRIFQQETGNTPARFVDAARLEFAKNLLITTNWPLARIADHSGYNSLDTLHRSFMKHLGTAPGFFRDRFGGVV